ncbi:MAG: hypothetical protein U5N58_03270 [Actinomycetota bacterium]|nr:hypothetical protein [Actinomycetota bacterium]
MKIMKNLWIMPLRGETQVEWLDKGRSCCGYEPLKNCGYGRWMRK